MRKEKALYTIKSNRAITIIALVVTIIILIILAGVSINLILGQDGIITKAKEAKENIELAKAEEEKQLNQLVDYLDNYGEDESLKEGTTNIDISLLIDALKYSDLNVTEENTYEEICQKLKEAYPALPLGTTYNFAYKGAVEEWVCECPGIYQLEVYGAQGGNSKCKEVSYGGNGGYSIGYKRFEKGDKLYICVGGAGTTASKSQTAGGGYNGGGNAGCGSSVGTYYKGGGGGATHIATMDGTLKSIGIDNSSKVLIVAGGGGGAGYDALSGTGSPYAGGSGGGTSGSNGIASTGGTQNVAGTVITSYGGYNDAGFGYGAYCTSTTVGGWQAFSGGGGGWYGGGGSIQSGSGGSGYIGGVPEITYKDEKYTPMTSNGANSGNGKAIITYVAY